MSIKEQAALMRLGIRFIEERELQGMWIGRVPTREDVDRWEDAATAVSEAATANPPAPRMILWHGDQP